MALTLTEFGPLCIREQVTLGVVGFTYAILKARKVQLARDGNDYKGGLGDFFNILRNADFEQHKAKDAKTSVRAWHMDGLVGQAARPNPTQHSTNQITHPRFFIPTKMQVDQYANLFDGARKEVGAISSEESIEGRRSQYQTMITNFYDLVRGDVGGVWRPQSVGGRRPTLVRPFRRCARGKRRPLHHHPVEPPPRFYFFIKKKKKKKVTDFYEYGWGQSFHFGPRWKGEGFVESIKRAEYHLCSRLGMKPGMRALDVGCGVGGPMRNMAIFSGAQIDGITINEYQVGPSIRSGGLSGVWWWLCWAECIVHMPLLQSTIQPPNPPPKTPHAPGEHRQQVQRADGTCGAVQATPGRLPEPALGRRHLRLRLRGGGA